MFKLNNKDFTIKNYMNQLAFASFLPGIAGKNGIPMWVYYVNRGQAIAGFGIENKDNPIFDFVPANQAYRRTELNGFRTFIRVDGEVHEMFSSRSAFNPEMTIKQNGLTLYENNQDIGVEVTVEYFNITSKDYPGLVRRVTIKSEKEVEVLDGLTSIYPRGMNNDAIKNMSNLSVAWIDVVDIDGIKLYKNRSTTADTAEMSEVNDGNFYASFDEEGNKLDVVYDLDIVFGLNTSLTFAQGFGEDFESKLNNQIHANKLPCAFTFTSGSNIVINSVIGAVENVDILKENAKDFNGEFILSQKELSENLVQDITSPIETVTNEPLFDAYMSQSYLDNILRGGYPLVFEGEDEDIIYHIYSRIHGDMEREYNYFILEPSFYSQGNGNFRDVNQNRRNDIFFVKESGLFNIKTFMNLIQLDGNNPLVIKGSTLTFNMSKFNELGLDDEFMSFFESEFTLGELAHFLHFTVDVQDVDKWVEKILKSCKQESNAQYGHGYWVDHWTYNMDLVDNYLKVYPDKLNELLFTEEYRFFESPDVVVPRSQKYVLTSNGVRQYGAIKFDQEKVDKLNIDIHSKNWTEIEGEVYSTSLYTKLITLAAVKYASLDPLGMGVMMESEKPGWNDAMNGLPGIFGSGVSETIELRRVLTLLKSAPEEIITMPVEVFKLIESLEDVVGFEATQEIKEEYRESIRLGLSGELVKLSTADLSEFINIALATVNEGIDKAIKIGEGLIPTFLSYEAVSYEETKEEVRGLPLVNVTGWRLKVLPKYLEAPARLMKQMDTSKAKAMHELVRESEMYDKNLKMYVTSESLEEESLEIGRARAFTAGWLERESCFMHMEFKYFYAQLKSGLYNEFFEDIKTALPAFMDPAVYGRSPLENSSFIATSRNPNPNNHGRGFVARLTGTSTEAISLWLMMMTGGKLFKFNDELEFDINPILPASFFKDGKVSFKVFSNVEIELVNETGKDTFGQDKAEIKDYTLVGDEPYTLTKVTNHHAESIREGRVTKVIVTYK